MMVEGLGWVRQHTAGWWDGGEYLSLQSERRESCCHIGGATQGCEMIVWTSYGAWMGRYWFGRMICSMLSISRIFRGS